MLNVQKNIILTHWGVSEDKRVFVTPNLSKYVQNYHLLQLRFLYSRYKNKFKGVVLNSSQDMVCPITISAFLSTIPMLPKPVLILSSDFNLKYWRYFLSLIPQANLQLNGSNRETKTKENNLVILLGTSKELFSAYDQYSMIIVDNIDSVINARTKRADFNIGITYRNFYRSPNDKLLWSILNWANIYFVGNFITFLGKYNEFLDNCIEAYPSIFLRTTWEFCDSFKMINLKELQNDINNNLDTSESSGSDEDIVANNVKKRKYTRRSTRKALKSVSSTKGSPRKNTTVQNNKRNTGQKFNATQDSFESHEPTLTLMKVSDEIFDPESNNSVDNASSSLNTIDDSLPNVKQEVTSSDEGIYNNSVIGKIVDSPTKNCDSLELLLEEDLSAFEDSDILSQIIDRHNNVAKRSFGTTTSVLDNIIDAKLNRFVHSSSFACDSDGDSNGESVLSRLFP